MKLDQEPRLPGEKPSIIDWARAVAKNFNLMVDAVGNKGETRTGTSDITTTLDSPAFSASLAADQAVTAGVFTAFAGFTEEFDTNNVFNAASGVFQPNVAGYYLIGFIATPQISAGTITDVRIQIWKNGATYKQPILVQWGIGGVGCFSGSILLPMNGTTDYVQLIGSINGTGISGQRFIAGFNNFYGHLARRA